MDYNFVSKRSCVETCVWKFGMSLLELCVECINGGFCCGLLRICVTGVAAASGLSAAFKKLLDCGKFAST